MWCAARHCAFESHPLRQKEHIFPIGGRYVFYISTGFSVNIWENALRGKIVCRKQKVNFRRLINTNCQAAIFCIKKIAVFHFAIKREWHILKKYNFSGGIVAGLCVLAVLTGFVVGFPIGRNAKESTTADEKKTEIMNLLEKDYLFDLDNEQLENDMYAGLLKGTGDIYAKYYSQEETEEFNNDTNGQKVGIGASIVLDEETQFPFVREVYPGSAAEKAGLMAGDFIVYVDGASLENLDLNQCTALILGQEGTDVVLDIIRNREDELKITVTRTLYTYTTVYHQMLPDSVGYMYIQEFAKSTEGEFKAAVDSLETMGAKGLVIDLRDNLGGDLEASVNMADYILKDNLGPEPAMCKETPITYLQDKNGNTQSYYGADGHSVELPIALVLNKYSASASELFSGALRDHGQGVIVGEKSFGKGIAQRQHILSDKSSVVFTVSEYIIPSGLKLHGFGLEPDIALKSQNDDSFMFTEENANKDPWILEAKNALDSIPKVNDSYILELPPKKALEEASACRKSHFSFSLEEAYSVLEKSLSQDDSLVIKCIEDDFNPGANEWARTYRFSADTEDPYVEYYVDLSTEELHQVDVYNLSLESGKKLCLSLLSAAGVETAKLEEDMQKADISTDSWEHVFKASKYKLNMAKSDGVITFQLYI